MLSFKNGSEESCIAIFNSFDLINGSCFMSIRVDRHNHDCCTCYFISVVEDFQIKSITMLITTINEKFSYIIIELFEMIEGPTCEIGLNAVSKSFISAVVDGGTIENGNSIWIEVFRTSCLEIDVGEILIDHSCFDRIIYMQMQNEPMKKKMQVDGKLKAHRFEKKKVD